MPGLPEHPHQKVEGRVLSLDGERSEGFDAGKWDRFSNWKDQVPRKQANCDDLQIFIISPGFHAAINEIKVDFSEACYSITGLDSSGLAS